MPIGMAQAMGYRYSFCVSFELSELGSSHLQLPIVYSNLWTRKSGFIWFLCMRSRFNLPIFLFFYFAPFFPACESLLNWFVSSSTRTDFLILRTAEPFWHLPQGGTFLLWMNTFWLAVLPTDCSLSSQCLEMPHKRHTYPLFISPTTATSNLFLKSKP